MGSDRWDGLKVCRKGRGVVVNRWKEETRDTPLGEVKRRTD